MIPWMSTVPSSRFVIINGECATMFLKPQSLSATEKTFVA